MAPMLTFGELQKKPARVSELGPGPVLVAASGTEEVVVQKEQHTPEATITFMHETIEMMKADRAEQLDKLRQQFRSGSKVVAIQKKPESFWDYVTVGRAASADIVIDDPATSNMHAQFTLNVTETAASIQDVGSSNGTFVNRQRIHPHVVTELSSGDCIRFGQAIFYYVENDTLREMLEQG